MGGGSERDEAGRRPLAALLWLLPASRRELGTALLAEASAVPVGWRRFSWLMGGLWFVFREAMVRAIGYVVGLVIAAAALITVDRLGTSDDSGQVSLAVLVAGAGALGFLAPRWAWLAGLVLGSAVAASELLAPAGVAHPADHLGPGGTATLFVLIVPGLIAAYLGAGASWLLRRQR